MSTSVFLSFNDTFLHIVKIVFYLLYINKSLRSNVYYSLDRFIIICILDISNVPITLKDKNSYSINK